MTDTGTAPDPFALLIQDMHRRHFQRDVQSNILAHGGSPRRPLHYQLQVLPDLSTGASRRSQTYSFAWREDGGCSSGVQAITPCLVIGRSCERSIIALRSANPPCRARRPKNRSPASALRSWHAAPSDPPAAPDCRRDSPSQTIRLPRREAAPSTG